jgi:acetolactate synthase-1/2/3 large subunit
VTRGPGATNASIAVHSAKYDSVPLVLLVGQVARSARGREAGQEIDYTHFFGTIAKWVIEINDARQVPRTMARAFHIARSGRPGPVIVSLPRDMLEEDAEISMIDPYPEVRSNPDPKSIEEMVGRINAANKPVLIAGSGTQYSDARQELIDFSEKFQVPVLTTYKRQDAFPNSHPNYIGNLANANRYTRSLVVNEADLVVVIGSRLNQQTTGGFAFPWPGQPFVQIYPDEQYIGQNLRPDLGIIADAKIALTAALKIQGPRPNESRAAWVAQHHAAQKRYSTPPERPTRRVSMERVMADLKAALPSDAITATDAGSFGQWPQRYLDSEHADSYFDSGLHGSGNPVSGSRQARSSGAAGSRAHRRRGISYDRARNGDGQTIRREHRRHRLQQRGLQFDPHAPGGAVSRPPIRHGSGQSRFRRARHRLRGLGHEGQARRGIFAGVQKGNGRRPVGADRSDDRL